LRSAIDFLFMVPRRNGAATKVQPPSQLARHMRAVAAQFSCASPTATTIEVLPMSERRFSPEQIEALARQVLGDGHCILRDQLPREKLERWREAFTPLLERHIEREGHLLNRGAARYSVTLPFIEPFADPQIFADADADVVAICERRRARCFRSGVARRRRISSR
jgi:hypothetical protein